MGGSRARAQTPDGSASAEEDVEVPSARNAPVVAPAAGPVPSAVPAGAAAADADNAKLRSWQADTSARLDVLQARVNQAVEVRKEPAPRSLADVAPEVEEKRAGEVGVQVLPKPGFLISGYAQGQYVASGASQDQIQQGGGLLNQDQFVVRRARLRADRRWTYAALALEIDGNTTAGLGFGVRRAEASLLWDREGEGAPLLALTAGMFYVPFGHELPASARTRLFHERSLSSSALFPGQADVGVRLAGSWRFLRYAVALVNGEPISESAARPFRGDPNASKDLVARVGADVAAASWLRLAGGVSFLQGKGFHPGVDATKSGTVWVDLDEDGQIDLGEVMAVPGSSASPSANFRHWAVGADLRVTLRTRFGLTQLSGEGVIAGNLDRGLFGSDPIASGVDVRQLGFYAAIVQDIGAWGLIGFRVDAYNPNLDAFDSRAGQLLPSSQTITTLSPLIGARIGDRVRVSVEYDRIFDNLARDAVGVPTDLKNDQVTARLQVDL